jgi:hypothetical protein
MHRFELFFFENICLVKDHPKPCNFGANRDSGFGNIRNFVQ